MRQISSTIVSVIALVMLVLIYQEAIKMGVPNFFTLFIIFVGILIVINLIRRWIRL
jgi:hypothetical protein